jgi:tetratricopeptide (TPR) repeat protein
MCARRLYRRFRRRPLCYNQIGMEWLGIPIRTRLFAAASALPFAALTLAVSASGQPHPSAFPATPQGIYVVFPFENRGASPHLDWLGEGLEELTIQRLSAAGESVYSRSGRASELERYGLPATAKLSRATMLRIAEDLDADYLVLGSFTSDGTSLALQARVIRVAATALRPVVRESGRLDSLMDVATRLVWRTVSANEQFYPLSLEDFAKKQRPLRLDAFEHYIRGLIAADDEAKLRNLREAARLEPGWPDADFALGELYFARRDCPSALPWFARVPKTHDRSVEAAFATGVCQLLAKQPERAEEIFAGIQESFRKSSESAADLPEVLNNLALARARGGKTAEAQQDLRRAVEMDPDEDAYPFNQGLLALRVNDGSAAAEHFREAAAREPDNPEDRAFLILALEKAGKKTEADEERESAAEAFGPKGVPVVRWDAKDVVANEKFERIKPELDTAQLQLRVKSANGNATVPASSLTAETPAALIRHGRQNLSSGQLDNADRAFRAALAAEPANAAAHRGLAEVDRRKGKLDDAVKELQASLEARDSAVAHTTLARVYLEQKKPELARAELEKTLKLAPNYTEARQLLEHLRNSKPGESKPKGGAQ